MKITDDDKRLLSDIGILYRKGVKNRFEVSLNGSSDGLNYDNTSNSYSPTQDQGLSKGFSPTTRRNGLDASARLENNELDPSPNHVLESSPMPMLALPSTRTFYNRSTERTFTGLNCVKCYYFVFILFYN